MPQIHVRTDGPDGAIWIPFAKKKARELVARCQKGPPALTDAILLPDVHIFIRAFRIGVTFVEINTAKVASPVLYWGSQKKVNGGAPEPGPASYTRRTQKLDREPVVMSFLDALRASYRIVLDGTLGPKVRIENRQTFACAAFDPAVDSDTYRNSAEGFAASPKFVRAPSGAKDEPVLCVAHVTGQRTFFTRSFISLGTVLGTPGLSAFGAPTSPDGLPYTLELQGYVGGSPLNPTIYGYGFYRYTSGVHTFDVTRPGSLTMLQPLLGAKLALRRAKSGETVREIDLHGLAVSHFEPLSAYPGSTALPASSPELAPAYGATWPVAGEFPSRYFYAMPSIGSTLRWEVGTSKYGFAIIAVRHVAAGALSGSVFDQIQTHVDVAAFTYKGELRHKYSRTFTASSGGSIVETPTLVLVQIEKDTTRCIIELDTPLGRKLVVMRASGADTVIDPPAGTWASMWNSNLSPLHVLGSAARHLSFPGLWGRDSGYSVTKFGIGAPLGRAVAQLRQVVVPSVSEDRATLLILPDTVEVDTLRTQALAGHVYFGAGAKYVVQRETRTGVSGTEQRLLVRRRSDKQALAGTDWGIEPTQLIVFQEPDVIRTCWVESLSGDRFAVGRLAEGRDADGNLTYEIVRTVHTYLTSKTVAEKLPADTPVEYLFSSHILEDG